MHILLLIQVPLERINVVIQLQAGVAFVLQHLCLGQAQVSPTLSPSIGLNFDKPVLKYKESKPKSNKYTQIDIDVRTQEDSYHYMIQIYDSGEATIRVRSLNRDPISFDGTMTISQ